MSDNLIDGLTQDEMNTFGWAMDCLVLRPEVIGNTLKRLASKYEKTSLAWDRLCVQMEVVGAWLSADKRTCRDIFLYCESFRTGTSVERVVGNTLHTLCHNWHHSAPSRRCRCGADRQFSARS